MQILLDNKSLAEKIAHVDAVEEYGLISRNSRKMDTHMSNSMKTRKLTIRSGRGTVIAYLS